MADIWWMKGARERERLARAEAKKSERWGFWTWDATGSYPERLRLSGTKIYKSKSAAQKVADTLYEQGTYVVVRAVNLKDVAEWEACKAKTTQTEVTA